MKETSSRGRLNGITSQHDTYRVAIYTRKSTDEGLDQKFNSLEAQREAVEEHVQRHQAAGWVALPERYDDGGYSGANTVRPAFQRLMGDAMEGKMDAVAVYKADRFGRDTAEVLQNIKRLQAHGVAFISVTENVSLETSVGRFVFRNLASMAEFERERIAERTKDKMAAMRRKGMWTGGRAVLGYDVVQKRLVVNKVEAEQVREVFRLFLALGSVIGVVEELRRRGWTTKHGKGAYAKPTVRSLLTSVLYIGKVEYQAEVYGAPHEAIIDQKTWAAAQHLMAQRPKRAYRPPTNRTPALLRGLARCGVCGASMAPHYSQKRGRRWGYYVCLKNQKEGAAACPGSRAPMADLEEFVVEKVRSIGKDPRLVTETIKAAKRQLEAKKPALEVELVDLEKEQRRLGQERGNLIAAIRQGGSSTSSLTGELAKADEALASACERAEVLQGQLAALENQTIDQADLRAALASFEPVWDELFPAERARILQLLLEEVRYDAKAQEVAITFRPGGVRVLARDGGRNDG